MITDRVLPNMLSQKSIRQGFKDWNSLKALGCHPLANLAIVKARHQVAGYTQTTAGRGLALREVLQTVLDTLKPGDGPPDPREKGWRPYVILEEQYLHGRSPDWVATQLHVSKGTYYSDQKRALEMVADILYKWEEQHYCQENEAIEDQSVSLRPEHQVPFLAPPLPAHPLMGREALLAELKQQLLGGRDCVLTALNGLPGVGKTTLAIALAHDPEIRNHFQDGVLWVGLGRQPDVLALLGAWATAVGIPTEVIANRSEITQRATAIHATIGLRRMLLIIDDAWQIEAALAFKVGGPNCAHLVTTRLANVALDFAGDNVVQVHELDLPYGLDLLAQLSPLAVETEPDEARKLVQSVGGLPLALILMGSYLRRQSYSGQPRRLREALTRLQAAETRLQLTQPQSPLESSPALPADTPLSLQAAIGLTDAALDPTTHYALLNLSLYAPKPNTFSEAAALAVIDAPVSVLDTLVDQGLVESIAPDRYSLHQTIADYAALPGIDLAAVERLGRYFVEYVEINRSELELLDLELTNILTALEAAIKVRLDRLFVRGANALHLFLETRGLYQLDEQYLQRACAMAEISGDKVNLALILYAMGDLSVKLGRFKEAQTHFQQSITLARLTHSRELEARILLDLGLACWYRGCQMEDRNYFERSLHLFRMLGERSGEGYALNTLGYACVELGDFGQARTYLEEALRVCRDSNNRRGEGWAHYNLGTVYLPLGDFARVKEHWDHCQSIYRELGDRRGEGWLIYNLGRFHRQLGNYPAALASFDQARQSLGELGDRYGLAFSLHNLGLVYGELGNDAAALVFFEQALQTFCDLGCQTGESQSYHSLGVRLRRLGDYEGARTLFEQALDIRRKMNYRRGESVTLSNLGLTYFYLSEPQRGQDYCQQGLGLAQLMGIRPTQGHALTYLGHVLRGMGQLTEAAKIYHQAINLRRDLGQSHLALDPQAGLAQTLLAQGILPQAQLVVDEILPHLKSGSPALSLEKMLAGSDDPGQIYLSCYQVLEANQDPRAQTILRTGHHFLRQRAAKIGDEEQRRLFLERVATHQKIEQLAAHVSPA
ncbi:MAG: tetratricopeptide repeat protein [Chloroflexota bacterium]